jgi:hypothetical protein
MSSSNQVSLEVGRASWPQGLIGAEATWKDMLKPKRLNNGSFHRMLGIISFSQRNQKKGLRVHKDGGNEFWNDPVRAPNGSETQHTP